MNTDKIIILPIT